MTMISRQQYKRTRKTFLTRIALIALFITAVVVLNVFGSNPFSRTAYFIAAPFLAGEQMLAGNTLSFLSLLKSKQALYEENQTLRTRLGEMEYLAIKNTALEMENKELTFLLGRKKEETTALARVISRPNVSPYDTAIIDIGSQRGIHVGDRVVALGDFLVGFVSRVYTNSAQVTFYSSPGQKTNILIGESATPASAEGRGANNFMARLPRDTDVAKDDIVVLSDAPGQIFGVVEKVNRNSTDAFQTVLFTNPVSVFSIKWVEVILSDGPIQ